MTQEKKPPPTTPAPKTAAKKEGEVPEEAPPLELNSMNLNSLRFPEFFHAMRLSVFFAIPALQALCTYFLRLQYSMFQIGAAFIPFYLMVFGISVFIEKIRKGVQIGPVPVPKSVSYIKEGLYTLRVYDLHPQGKLIHCASMKERERYILQFKHVFHQHLPPEEQIQVSQPAPPSAQT